jgi:hypothetical protein
MAEGSPQRVYGALMVMIEKIWPGNSGRGNRRGAV